MEPHESRFDYSKDQGIPEVLLRVDLLRNRLEKCIGRRDLRILEVGVGSGENTVMLAELFEGVTCVDPDEKTCHQVSRRLQDLLLHPIQFIQANIEDAPLSPEGYDHVILQNILEHLSDPIRVLSRLAFFLRPRGTILICVPLAHSWHRILGVEMGLIGRPEELAESDIRYGHCRVYTPPLIREHIRLAGLNICHEQPIYLKPLPTAVMTPLSMEIHKALFSLGQKFPEWASYLYLEARA